MSGDVGTDSRRSERKPLRKAVVLVVEMGEEPVNFDASTIDICEYGTRIQTTADLKAGQVLHLVRPENPDEPVRCLVVWTADVTSDKRGEAGLEFLKTLPTPLES
jgi:hypothetical protein